MVVKNSSDIREGRKQYGHYSFESNDRAALKSYNAIYRHLTEEGIHVTSIQKSSRDGKLKDETVIVSYELTTVLLELSQPSENEHNINISVFSEDSDKAREVFGKLEKQIMES